MPYNASIERRCFNKNFPSVGKYIPYDTAILRISDVGGVVGSFYINNNFSNKIETDIIRLFENIEEMFKIKKMLYCMVDQKAVSQHFIMECYVV